MNVFKSYSGKTLRILLAGFLSCSPVRAGEGPAPVPYRIGLGDELLVSIQTHGALGDVGRLSLYSPLVVLGQNVYSQHKVTVAPDGTIVLISPLPLSVEGKTLEEAAGAISARLPLREGRSPVTVALSRSETNVVYVWGEVYHPGKHLLQGSATLLEGIGLAGGPLPKAVLKSVKLIRPSGETLSVDLSSRGDSLAKSLSIPLGARDTIFVPRKKTPDQAAVLLLLAVISTVTGVYVAARQD